MYELYGPGGVAILVNTLTDNKNRTVAEIKHLVSKLGYQLATPGSALWAFSKGNVGWDATTTVPLAGEDREKLDSLVEALEEHDDVESIYTNAS